MLLGVLTIHLMAMGVEAELIATLAPPLHLSGGRGSWTVLVCLVTDAPQANMEVTWLSSRAGGASDVPYRVAREEDGTHSAISLISVASDEWESYTCFVSYRSSARVIRRHYAGFTDEGLGGSCNEDVSEVIHTQSDAMLILALRILLLKTIIFNFLMTAVAVIK
ncbi:hypothetical protein MATL_G00066250 [Megalops atlanticus]|uniref:Ig-like domain-containing protein n=1 Tax=Megalops atlanticus TaxID=7932 RepID=A0A9D3QBJ5_MEGAT|nr:hypothetical protein MATL_G00066250 [Megalops atlanticus]